MWALRLIERGLVPDALVRLGVRQLARQGLQEHAAADKDARIEELRDKPIAQHTEAANQQHYNLPPAFFEAFLGPWLKYSACYWPDGVETLAGAEEAMLRLTAEGARLADGQMILDLGCGWGSLTLWAAEHYPHSRITAVSNAASQRDYIRRKAAERGLDNIDVITADAASLELEVEFDRVVSVEMFEHMKNVGALLERIAAMMRPGGLLFVHHFSHRAYLYEFDHTDPDDWMAQHFFTGGTMPSHDLLTYFQDDLRVVEQWRIRGTHYARTLNTWLDRFDANLDRIQPIINRVYSRDPQKWLAYWRLFFLSSAETFGLNDGGEYGITHTLMAKP
ncbi:MAG: class I SAM-dependent methyltransferase [Chloroflexi bacterium]|nr:class I SAM-dependent methyltransferase [Chloroflexota bacterium]